MLSTGGHAGGLALEAPITVLCVGCRHSLSAALSSHGLVIVFVALCGVGVGAGGPSWGIVGPAARWSWQRLVPLATRAWTRGHARDLGV